MKKKITLLTIALSLIVSLSLHPAQAEMDEPQRIFHQTTGDHNILEIIPYEGTAIHTINLLERPLDEDDEDMTLKMFMKTAHKSGRPFCFILCTRKSDSNTPTVLLTDENLYPLIQPSEEVVYLGKFKLYPAIGKDTRGKVISFPPHFVVQPAPHPVEVAVPYPAPYPVAAPYPVPYPVAAPYPVPYEVKIHYPVYVDRNAFVDKIRETVKRLTDPIVSPIDATVSPQNTIPPKQASQQLQQLLESMQLKSQDQGTISAPATPADPAQLQESSRLLQEAQERISQEKREAELKALAMQEAVNHEQEKARAKEKQETARLKKIDDATALKALKEKQEETKRKAEQDKKDQRVLQAQRDKEAAALQKATQEAAKQKAAKVKSQHAAAAAPQEKSSVKKKGNPKSSDDDALLEKAMAQAAIQRATLPIQEASVPTHTKSKGNRSKSAQASQEQGFPDLESSTGEGMATITIDTITCKPLANDTQPKHLIGEVVKGIKKSIEMKLFGIAKDQLKNITPADTPRYFFFLMDIYLNESALLTAEEVEYLMTNALTIADDRKTNRKDRSILYWGLSVYTQDLDQRQNFLNKYKFFDDSKQYLLATAMMEKFQSLEENCTPEELAVAQQAAATVTKTVSQADQPSTDDHASSTQNSQQEKKDQITVSLITNLLKSANYKGALKFLPTIAINKPSQYWTFLMDIYTKAPHLLSAEQIASTIDNAKRLVDKKAKTPQPLKCILYFGLAIHADTYEEKETFINLCLQCAEHLPASTYWERIQLERHDRLATAPCPRMIRCPHMQALNFVNEQKINALDKKGVILADAVVVFIKLYLGSCPQIRALGPDRSIYIKNIYDKAVRQAHYTSAELAEIHSLISEEIIPLDQRVQPVE